jgi:pimeloyl-ACP methyl ester carboxylesterase
MSNRLPIRKFLYVLGVLLLLTPAALSMKAMRSLSNPFWNLSQSSAALSAECPDTEFASLLAQSTNTYTFDHYDVQTDDGPIIALFRIRLAGEGLAKLPENQKANAQRPILLQHGLTSSADAWFLNGQKGSIGFHLADQGYDVWVGNNRGNKYSKKDRNPNVTRAEFWNFSFAEMGHFDLPANYKKILSFYPEGQKIFYVAHSQGTTQMFAAGSMPETRDFVAASTEMVIAIEPIAYMTHTGQKIASWFSGLSSAVNTAAIFVGINEILTSSCGGNPTWDSVVVWACDHMGFLCNLGWDFSGYDPKFDNTIKDMGNFMRHNPNGASVQSMAHFGQLISAKKPTFAKYDWGADKNFELYGQDTPTEYDMSTFNLPLVVARGTADNLSTSGNLDELLQRIGTPPVKIFTLEGWNHHTWEIPVQAELILNIIDEQL